MKTNIMRRGISLIIVVALFFAMSMPTFAFTQNEPQKSYSIEDFLKNPSADFDVIY